MAAALAPVLRDVHAVVLPASPDGRDLAPRLAYALGRPLLAGAIAVGPTSADVLARGAAKGCRELTPSTDPFVATLEPGVRGVGRRTRRRR